MAVTVSPLTSSNTGTIIEITDDALVQLKILRDAEPEPERLGLRLEVLTAPLGEFEYDLSFATVTQAAFSDEVRTINGLKIIIPLATFEFINGATLDYSERQGLVVRNPNKPPVAAVEGLVNNDDHSLAIKAVITEDVNPALDSHGGYVTFVGHDTEGVVYLTMGGGCHGCAMSKVTMLEGVQTILVEKVPGVQKVRDVTDHETGSNPYYS
jgi:Fe/S biogenesis protein NfuA